MEGALHLLHAHAHKVVVGESRAPALVQQPDAFDTTALQRDEEHGRGAPRMRRIVRPAVGGDQALGVRVLHENLQRRVLAVAHRRQDRVAVRAPSVELAASVEKDPQHAGEASVSRLHH